MEMTTVLGVVQVVNMRLHGPWPECREVKPGKEAVDHHRLTLAVSTSNAT